MPTPLHDAIVWQPLQVELIESSPADSIRLRAMLELLGAQVTLHEPASPQALLRLLHRPEQELKLLILDGHGDENGLFVPELDKRLRHQELANVGDHLPTEMLRPYMYLPGWDVINLCCMGGSEAMVDAFKHAGVRNYIAPDGYPDGTTATLFAAHMVDYIQHDGLLLAEAWAKAVGYEPDAAMFTLTTADGVERLG